MSEERTITVNRRAFAAMLATTRYMMTRSYGQQTAYAGARQYYDVLGYPTEITLEACRQRYDRQDIAGPIIDLPAVSSWRNPPQVSEDGNTETAFVQAWEQLVARHELGVWGSLAEADKLSGIGKFGALLIGLRGDGSLSDAVREGALSSPADVLYLNPFSEEDVEIRAYEEDTGNARYGWPVVYEIQLREDDEDKTPVHWTRVLHVAEGGRVFGVPRLAGVWNRLDDLQKVVGGGAEAAWLGMRPGTILRPMEGYRLDMTDDEIEEEIENYVHDPMRLMFLRGVEGQQLGPMEIPDPRALYEVTLGLISARCRIPQRVLEGSAKGELAASREDTRQWAGEVAARQKTYVEPYILRRFVDRLVDFGVLPRPANGYHVGQLGDDGEWHWPSIVQVTEDERAEIAQARSAAAKNLADPLASYPLTDGEQRELLGYPAERPEEEAIAAQRLRVQQGGPPDRGDFEAQLQAALRAVFRRHRRGVDVDDPDLDAMGEDLTDALVPTLMAAGKAGLAHYERQFQLFLAQDRLVAQQSVFQRLADWVVNHARAIANGILDTTREMLGRARGESGERRRELVDQAFVEDRADRTARTEVTAGLSMGGLLYQREARERYGVEVVLAWYTREDERVCPVCEPLHGATEDWTQTFPEGPPAHVNCRCGLEARLE